MLLQVVIRAAAGSEEFGGQKKSSASGAGAAGTEGEGERDCNGKTKGRHSRRRHSRTAPTSPSEGAKGGKGQKNVSSVFAPETKREIIRRCSHTLLGLMALHDVIKEVVDALAAEASQEHKTLGTGMGMGTASGPGGLTVDTSRAPMSVPASLLHGAERGRDEGADGGRLTTALHAGVLLLEEVMTFVCLSPFLGGEGRERIMRSARLRVMDVEVRCAVLATCGATREVDSLLAHSGGHNSGGTDRVPLFPFSLPALTSATAPSHEQLWQALKDEVQSHIFSLFFSLIAPSDHVTILLLLSAEPLLVRIRSAAGSACAASTHRFAGRVTQQWSGRGLRAGLHPIGSGKVTARLNHSSLPLTLHITHPHSHISPHRYRLCAPQDALESGPA